MSGTRLPPPSRAHMVALANHAIANRPAVDEPPQSCPAPLADVMRGGQTPPSSSARILPVAAGVAMTAPVAAAFSPPAAPVAAAATTIRAKMPSIEALPTDMIQVSPAFLDALRRVAPKRKVSRVTYVIGVAMCMIFGVLAVDRSTRTFVVNEGHALVSMAHADAPAPRTTAGQPEGAPAQPVTAKPGDTPAATMP